MDTDRYDTGQNYIQVKNVLTSVDSQFSLYPSPNCPRIRARRQWKLRINLARLKKINLNIIFDLQQINRKYISYY